ncbi:MAG: LytTR family DNA-binding domain-containing protein [Pseudomonadota bacterium]
MRFVDYMLEHLPADLSAERQFHLLSLVFGVTFLFVVVIHQFMPSAQSWWDIIVHALIVATTYLASFGLLAAVLFYLNNGAGVNTLRVWQVWAFSFIGYNLGFFAYVPFGDNPRLVMHQDIESVSSLEHYLRLIPVWALITYVFVEVYQKQSYQNALLQLRRINQSLKTRAPLEEKGSTGKLLDFTTPRKPLILSTTDLSHISVDDHYCYLYHRRDDGCTWAKSDVGIPLKEVLEQLPDNFIQVHRSHVVNTDFIDTVGREGRNYFVCMKDGSQIPVSRGKRDEILPLLEQSL